MRSAGQGRGRLPPGTAEALHQEQVRYTARAGAYAGAAAPEAVLAEHAVALVQRENAKWVPVQEGATRQQLTTLAGQPDSTPAAR